MTENRCPVCGKGELTAGELSHYRGLLDRRAPSPVVAEVVKVLRSIIAEDYEGGFCHVAPSVLEELAFRLERGE